MAEEAADEEAAAKAEDDEAAAEEDAFPFSHLRDLARSDAPMAYSLVGHSRVSVIGICAAGRSEEDIMPPECEAECGHSCVR